MLSDDRDNLRKAKIDGITGISLRDYVSGLDDAERLLDMVSTGHEQRVGKQTKGEKMAPFIVGDGPKTFRGLGAREHTLRVRK